MHPVTILCILTPPPPPLLVSCCSCVVHKWPPASAGGGGGVVVGAGQFADCPLSVYVCPLSVCPSLQWMRLQLSQCAIWWLTYWHKFKCTVATVCLQLQIKTRCIACCFRYLDFNLCRYKSIDGICGEHEQMNEPSAWGGAEEVFRS